MHEIELTDQAELNTLVNAISLNDGSLAVFAIAPDSSPLHPVVQVFKEQLVAELDGPVQFSTLHYSDDSVFRFLGRCEGEDRSPGRQVVMIFGLEQLPQPRLKLEMEQLNLGRERIFEHDLVLVFWLNRAAFLDEFRRRAADFWDWRGNVVTFVTCPPMEQLLYPYLEWLIAENSYLKMSGVMQVNRQVDISLDQIYVSLQAEWVEERSQSFRERVSPGVGRSRRNSTLGEPDEFEEEFRDEPLMEMSAEPASRQRVTKMMDVAEAVRQREYGVILGDPGAGKTTLLRYLARHFAIAHREGRSTVTGGVGEDLGGARLPILFRIADFAEKLVLEPELGLVEYLRRFYRQWEGGGAAGDGDAVAELLLSKMVTGDCLLLLDGLDEVLDGEYRGRVVRAIDRLVSDYPSNKFVITSRIAGYQEASLGSRFREFTITPMGNEQIKNFLGRWCLAIEVAQRPDAETSLQVRDAAREASGIFHAIETKPGVKRFAANPLLLTILALIHRNGAQMPQRRVELYALATKTLIEDWQFGRNAAYGAQAKQLTLVEEEVTALLAPLAFRMHDEKSSGVVTQAELEEWLVPLMEDSQGVEADVALGLVREFLQKVRETTGLFVERGPGVYGFMHLTFEEYYAARHLASNDVPDILEMIRPYLYEARWNEPILLALGYLSKEQKQVNRLLEKMFEGLVSYQPIVVGQEIRLKNVTSDPVLVWRSEAEGEAQESAEVWKDLLFVGQILAEVKVAPKFCRQQVNKLVLTYVGLDGEFGNEAIQQVLRLFRGIESFNGQILERLQKSSIDEQLSEEQRDRVLVAILYVVCGEVGDRLVDHTTEIMQRLTPWLFIMLGDLLTSLEEEIIPTLKEQLENYDLNINHRKHLNFLIGVSCIKLNECDTAISYLNPLVNQLEPNLESYIILALALAHQCKEDYVQALSYYRQYPENLKSPYSMALLGSCYSADKQYDNACKCFQEAINILRESEHDSKIKAAILSGLGRVYQNWNKHREAIKHHQKSLDIYQKLKKDREVAHQWFEMSNCYRGCKEYEKSIECQEYCLEIRKMEGDQENIAQAYHHLSRIYRDWERYPESLESKRYELDIRDKLSNQVSIALVFHQLGRIYADWGKYEESLTQHKRSRDLYQKSQKEESVANQWDWISDCYQELGKYSLAVDSKNKELSIRQKLDDDSKIALLYSKMGDIYKDWRKYQKTIDQYKESCDLYRQIGQQEKAANQCHKLAVHYREWGNYEKSIETENQSLEIYKEIDDNDCIAFSYWYQGSTYGGWERYSTAIEQYQKSVDLYQDLDKEDCVSDIWYSISNIYSVWGKYDKALEAEQNDLAIRQKFDDQPNIADAYSQFGRIYQAWSKYEKAIEYHQQSLEIYQQLDKTEDITRQLRHIAHNQRQLAQETADRPSALNLLNQAEQNLQQSIQLNTENEYQANLAYDRISLSLLYADRLRHPEPATTDLIHQFETNYAIGLTALTDLGKTVSHAGETLDIARAYLEIPALQNLTLAETLASRSLETFQEFNRRKLQANAHKLLGEIHTAKNDIESAVRSFMQSREIYCAIDLPGKVEAIDRLLG